MLTNFQIHKIRNINLYISSSRDFTSVRSLSDLPQVIQSHNAVWLRIADPAADTHAFPNLAKLAWSGSCNACNSTSCARFEANPSSHARPEPMRRYYRHRWMVHFSNSVAWFAETWNYADVQAQWPCLTKEAQRHSWPSYALRGQQRARRAAACAYPQKRETRLPKPELFTTAWPLQMFVQLVAAWAHKHKWSIIDSRVAGECNTWANQLIRGNFSACT